MCNSDRLLPGSYFSWSSPITPRALAPLTSGFPSPSLLTSLTRLVHSTPSQHSNHCVISTLSSLLPCVLVDLPRSLSIADVQVGRAHHRPVPSAQLNPQHLCHHPPTPQLLLQTGILPSRANFVPVSTLALSIRNTSILYSSHKLTYISFFFPYFHSLLFHLLTAMFHGNPVPLHRQPHSCAFSVSADDTSKFKSPPFMKIRATQTGASLVAQTVKRLPTVRETRVRSLSQEDPLEKEMATHSSTLAWKLPWTEEPGRLQSMGSQRVGRNWATSLQHRVPASSVSALSSLHFLTFISAPAPPWGFHPHHPSPHQYSSA